MKIFTVASALASTAFAYNYFSDYAPSYGYYQCSAAYGNDNCDYVYTEVDADVVPPCGCDNPVVAVTGEGMTTDVGAATMALKITKPLTLNDKNEACGTLNTLLNLPDDTQYASTSYQTGIHQQLTVSDAKCLHVECDQVWFSNEVTHYSDDPRKTLAENAQMGAAVRQGRAAYIGRMDNNHDCDTRSQFYTFVPDMIEGIDNPVSPVGAVNTVILPSYDCSGDVKTAINLCDMKDDMFKQSASFKLVCTRTTYGGFAFDCSQPIDDATSPNGLYMPQFHKFVESTSIQWLDCNGNDLGAPVENCIKNLMNPPHGAIHPLGSETFKFTEGGIDIKQD